MRGKETVHIVLKDLKFEFNTQQDEFFHVFVLNHSVTHIHIYNVNCSKLTTFCPKSLPYFLEKFSKNRPT